MTAVNSTSNCPRKNIQSLVHMIKTRKVNKITILIRGDILLDIDLSFNV